MALNSLGGEKFQQLAPVTLPEPVAEEDFDASYYCELLES